MQPQTCAVVICLDGCEPEYLDVAIAEGLMPNLARIQSEGTARLAHSVIPSFTNPNNVSIATGRLLRITAFAETSFTIPIPVKKS